MKIYIKFTKSEQLAINTLDSIFKSDGEKCKGKIIKHFDKHITHTITNTEDGGSDILFECTEEIFCVVVNWVSNIAAQCKGLILGAIDTYKNIAKMCGIPHLEIDGEKHNLCHPVKITESREDVTVTAVRYIPYENDEETAKKCLAMRVGNFWNDVPEANE